MTTNLNALAEASGNAEQASTTATSHFSAARLKDKLVLDTRNYFVSKIIPGLMGLLSVTVFVRLVGYEQYGRYAVLVALVTACAAGGAGWLGQGILRFQSQNTGVQEEETFGRAVNLGVLLSATLGTATVVVILWSGPGRSGFVTAAALILFVPMLMYTVELTRLQASLRSGAVVTAESIRAISSFLIPLILIQATSSRNYLLLLCGVGVGYVFPLLGQLRARSRQNIRGQWRMMRFGETERRALSTVWNYGWPVALWLFCQQSLVVSDRFFIRRSWGYSAAGVYASTYDVIVRSFSLLFAPITLSVHTVLMHHWNQGDRQSTMPALKKAIKYELLLFAPVATGLFFLNAQVARLILGKPNPEAAAAVLPLAVGGLLWQLALLAHKPLEMLCRTKRMLFGVISALVTNVAGNYFLVPRFGFEAAAYLSVASSCLYLLMLLFLIPVDEFRAAANERSCIVVPVEDTST